MNFTAATKDLLTAIKTAGIKDPRVETPLFFAATKTGVRVIGFCGDTHAVGIPAKVQTHGTVCVDLSRITEVLGMIPAKVKEVTISLNGGLVEVNYGKGRLKTFAREDELGKDIPAKVAITLPAKAFIHLLSSVRYAASDDEIRYNLRSVYLHTPPRKKLLRAVTTDGHRLAMEECPLDATLKKPLLLQVETVDFLLKALTGNEKEPVTISLPTDPKDVRGVVISCGSVSACDRTIDGTFPEYDRVSPRQKPLGKIKIGTADLVDPLAMAIKMSSSKIAATILDFFADKSKVVVKASNADKGLSLEEDLIVKGKLSEPMLARINARYLLDTTRKCGDTMTIEVRKGGNNDYDALPFVITGNGHTAVIMPMRL